MSIKGAACAKGLLQAPEPLAVVIPASSNSSSVRLLSGEDVLFSPFSFLGSAQTARCREGPQCFKE